MGDLSNFLRKSQHGGRTANQILGSKITQFHTITDPPDDPSDPSSARYSDHAGGGYLIWKGNKVHVYYKPALKNVRCLFNEKWGTNTAASSEQSVKHYA